jgi:hypothetical protein
VVLGADATQSWLALGHSGDAGSVDGIGLASVTAIEETGACSQRRRHVEHGLVGCGQLLGEEASETAGTLDGPDPDACPYPGSVTPSSSSESNKSCVSR